MKKVAFSRLAPQKHSKKIQLLIRLGLAAAAPAILGQSSQAATLTWDAAGISPVTPVGGTGIWDLSALRWSNGVSDLAWSATTGTSDVAVFGGTAGTVTLGTNLNALGLVFNTPGYTVTGNTLSLGASGIDASAVTSGTTTVSSNLSLSGGQYWKIGSGGTLAINGTVTRSLGATVNFSTAGTITSSTLTNTNGILGGWAVRHSGSGDTATGIFASISGGTIVDATQTSVSGNQTGAGATAQNWSTTANAALTTSATVNSLAVRNDFSVNSGATLTLGSGGLILSGVSRWLTNNGAGSTTGTGQITSGGSELFVDVSAALVAGTNQANNWRIWTKLVDNGAAVNLVKQGAGGVVLENNNTFTGQLIVNEGVVALGGTNTMSGTIINKGAYVLPGVPTLQNIGSGGGNIGYVAGTLGTGAVTVNGGVLQLNFKEPNTGRSEASNITLGNGGAIWVSDGSSTLSGNIAVTNGGGYMGATYRDPGNSIKGLYLTGVLSGSGPLALEQAGAGGNGAPSALAAYNNTTGNNYNASNVVVSNNANTYSGTVTVYPYTTGSAGGSWLTLGGSTALASATINLTGNNNVVSGQYGTSTLLFQSGLGNAFTIGGLTGSGNVSLSTTTLNNTAATPAAVALAVGNNNGSTTYSGVIADGGASGGSLTKVGTGTLTLSGANTYTGGTNVNAGILSLGSSGALGSTGTIGLGGGTLQASASNTTDYSARFSTAASQSYKIDTNGQSVTWASALTSPGGTLMKSGSGTLTLTSNSSSYSGATTVSAGTLLLNGSLGNTAVSVNNTGTLGGSGTIGTGTSSVTVNNGGTLAPGNSPGTVIVNGSAILNSGSIYAYQYTGGATAADLVDVNGALTITAGTILTLQDLGVYTMGDKFTLFAYDSLVGAGTFAGYADDLSYTVNGGEWLFNYNDTSAGLNGGTGAGYVTITAVPEPAAVLLGSLGMLVILRRRRA